MSESQSTGAGLKRKKPPTFQHLPLHRAKTLKKAWVEKTKIKSKWKAEKRKEDLSSRSKLDIPVYEDEERHDSVKTAAEDYEAEPDGTRIASPRTAKMNKSANQAPHIHPSRAHIHPDLPVKQISKVEQEPSDSRPAKKRKRSEAEPAEAVSLRDLTREAYSPATLHTFKADPLKKRHHSNSNGDRGARGGARGRGRGGHGISGTGRGQPNMKLRMNAMLAKIKQDFA